MPFCCFLFILFFVSSSFFTLLASSLFPSAKKRGTHTNYFTTSISTSPHAHTKRHGTIKQTHRAHQYSPFSFVILSSLSVRRSTFSFYPFLPLLCPSENPYSPNLTNNPNPTFPPPPPPPPPPYLPHSKREPEREGERASTRSFSSYTRAALLTLSYTSGKACKHRSIRRLNSSYLE
jgi:hypothetical protein